MRVAELDGSSRVLAGNHPNDGVDVSWGSADFVAAEEMHRFRGYWWSPDGRSIAACRVDDGPVAEWTIADPADPSRPARTVRYPAAGTDNPIVTLHVLGLDGSRLDVDWDREFFPYLAHVEWTDDGLLMSVQSRDQRGSMAMKVDLATGEAIALTSDYDDAWIENVPGVPRLFPGWLAPDRIGPRRDASAVRRRPTDHTARPPGPIGRVHRRSRRERGTGHRLSRQRSRRADRIARLVDHRDNRPRRRALRAGPVDRSARPPRRRDRWQNGGGPVGLTRPPGATHTVLVDGLFDGPVITSHAETPSITPNVTLIRSGERDLATAVLLPGNRDPDDDTPLPVLLDPYGGPHAQRVTVGVQHVSVVAVVRRPRVRGHRRRRPRHAGSWTRMGTCRPPRPRQSTARRPDRRTACLRRAFPVPRPRPRRHSRLELRRLPRRAGGAATPRRLPCRDRRGAGDRVAAVRHALHGALPRRPSHR